MFRLFGSGIILSAFVFQIVFCTAISKSELRKAFILYNLQTDALRAKLLDKIDVCLQQNEEVAVVSLRSSLELLINRQETFNTIFSQPFSFAMKDQLIQRATKTLISVKQTVRSVKC